MRDNRKVPMEDINPTALGSAIGSHVLVSGITVSFQNRTAQQVRARSCKRHWGTEIEENRSGDSHGLSRHPHCLGEHLSSPME